MTWTASITIAALGACLAACSGPGPGAPMPSDPSPAETTPDQAPPTALRGALVDPACAGQPVAYDVRPFDLGEAPRAARVVVLSGSPCLGPTGQLTELWVAFRGEWVSQLKTTGTLKALPTQQQGYADLTADSPGSCAPLWRWEGSGYRPARTCP